MALDIGDKNSALFTGLSGFWQRFFKDTPDLEAFYQASELYLGQVYLDLLGNILNIGIADTPIFNKEYWKLFAIKETELNFKQGESVAEDVFIYRMPDDIVSVDFLQNTIFEPDIVLERGVDFSVLDNDGYARFNSDPFRAYQDDTGAWMPLPGVGWRTVKVEVGNRFTDQQQVGIWDVTTNVKRGDDLRILAHNGVFLRDGIAGSLVLAGSTWIFFGTDVHLCKVGDVIQVYNSVAPDAAVNGFYIVKSVDNAIPHQAILENTGYLPSAGSVNPLTWKQYQMTYLENFQDYEIGYIDDTYLVGSVDEAFPLDLKGPVVYSVVRDPYDYQERGAILTWSSGALPLPVITILDYKHIIPGTFKVYAVSITGGPLVEGIDYVVDYQRGIFYQLTYWKVGSLGKCDYDYREEVFLAAGGQLSSYTTGQVKQISFWVPEVQVDRFNLWYDYGSLLNRFEASSESYQAFLRGIMHLYMMGPILERVEAALNVAARYPVVKNDGEVLTGYDSGVNGTGTDGTIAAAASSFNTPTYTFGEIDVGGYVVITNALSALNEGKFRILSLIDANTVELESSYGFADETPVDWVVTRTYKKTVTTDQRIYEYPYYVPMRTDVQDSLNFNVLTFKAFEPLTLAFTVTDYIEDPQWWHNKYIPAILWANTSSLRRYATNELFENVIGAWDDPYIGDPGFFIGADEEGNVFTPDDNLGNPVSLYRHNAAFLLFDRYLKMHMFFIEFDSALELDMQFQNDLKELILVAKPSYTYPYIEPDISFFDEITLEDLFALVGFTFHWGGAADGEVDSALVGKYVGSDILSMNNLFIGDADFPWSIGDYITHVPPSIHAVPGAPSPVTPGYTFTVPGMIAGDRVIDIQIAATAGGEPVLEGRDYTVNYLVENPPGTPNPDAWTVTALTTWDAVVPLNVIWRGTNTVNLSTVPLPDTRLGYTPIPLNGLNPYYVRHTAINPEATDFWTQWLMLRTEMIDYMLSLVINADTGVPGGVSYTYL